MTSSLALHRVRRYLDEYLFPDAPPPPRITARRAMVCAGLAVAGVAIQMARMWPSAPLNSIWQEDGYTWLADAMNRGFFDTVTTPYNGYLQTLSRLVAEPVAALPVDWFAAAMAISGAAIVTGCAFVVWRASAGHIENPYLRVALAAMVVLLPIVGAETLDNVTNAIWFLLFASFWLLLWRPPTFARAVGAAGLIFLSAVSNAGIVLMLPLWLLRLIAIRDRRDGIIVAAFAVGVAVQLGLSWDEMNLRGENGGGPISQVAPGLPFSTAPYWDWGLLPAYVQRIVGGAVTGQRISGYLWEQFGTPFEVVLGAALVVLVVVALAGTNRRNRVLVPLTVGTSVALFLVAGYRRWGAGGFQFLWPHGTSNALSSHYMVAPTLLLLSALFVQLDVRLRSLSATAWDGLRVGAVSFLLLAALVSFNVGDSATRGTPTWSDALDGARSECASKDTDTVEVPIERTYIGESRMPVPCSELNRSVPMSDREVYEEAFRESVHRSGLPIRTGRNTRSAAAAAVKLGEAHGAGHRAVAPRRWGR